MRIALAIETVGDDAAQLLNMAFGNTSLHDDVVLLDLDLPPEMKARFGGPGTEFEGSSEPRQCRPSRR